LKALIVVASAVSTLAVASPALADGKNHGSPFLSDGRSGYADASGHRFVTDGRGGYADDAARADGRTFLTDARSGYSGNTPRAGSSSFLTDVRSGYGARLVASAPTVRNRGFEWRAAGLGALATLALVALAGGTIVLVRRISRPAY
jgi:hypothetical protein